jgi:hypothetical protein
VVKIVGIGLDGAAWGCRFAVAGGTRPDTGGRKIPRRTNMGRRIWAARESAGAIAGAAARANPAAGARPAPGRRRERGCFRATRQLNGGNPDLIGRGGPGPIIALDHTRRHSE